MENKFICTHHCTCKNKNLFYFILFLEGNCYCTCNFSLWFLVLRYRALGKDGQRMHGCSEFPSGQHTDVYEAYVLCAVDCACCTKRCITWARYQSVRNCPLNWRKWTRWSVNSSWPVLAVDRKLKQRNLWVMRLEDYKHNKVQCTLARFISCW
jgi:hypothetical protein